MNFGYGLPEALGIATESGSIELGKPADRVVAGDKPLVERKVSFGTAAIRATEGDVEGRTNRARYTISRGTGYDAEALRQRVRDLAREARHEAGRKLAQPGRG